MNYQNDPRIVMTLDAGGQSFRFNAVRGGEEIIGELITMPTAPDNLDLSLSNMVNGFRAVRDRIRDTRQEPVAISFAFPGPADYPNGITWNIGNLPAYYGVALTKYLSKEFGIPVFINNDGDLYAYGEALAGYLPWINGQLAAAGSPKRYNNLVGVTLGTGFGGGIVRGGELFMGDNSSSTEVWLLGQRYSQQMNMEESVSTRAVIREYGKAAGIPESEWPRNSLVIYEIAKGEREGNQAAALESFRLLGRALGDALSNILTIVDGIAVIGGGVAKSYEFFAPAMMEEIASHFTTPTGASFPRLAQKAFYLNDNAQLTRFLKGELQQARVPHSDEQIVCDSMARVGIGTCQMGTTKAISVGAYVFALNELDRQK